MHMKSPLRIGQLAIAGVLVFVAACDAPSRDVPNVGNELEQYYIALEKYSELTVTDREALVRGRAAAVNAALELTRQCLGANAECRDVAVALVPDLLSKFRAISSELKVTRVEVVDERDDRKRILAMLDSPEYPAVVAITIDAQRGRTTRIQVSQQVVN